MSPPSLGKRKRIPIRDSPHGAPPGRFPVVRGILPTLTLLLLACPALRGAQVELDLSLPAPEGRTDPMEPLLGGEGPPATWEILPSATGSGPLAQTSQVALIDRFPMLVHSTGDIRDFELTTRIRLVSGRKARSAGIVFRLQDRDNHYTVRLDAQGGWFVFRKVVNGREEEPIGNRHPVRTGEWHTLRVSCRGTHIDLKLDDVALPTLIDNQFASGRVGLWTRGDTVAWFADTRLRYRTRESPLTRLLSDLQAGHRWLEDMSVYARPDDDRAPVVIADTDGTRLGAGGDATILDCLDTRRNYTARREGDYIVTVPVRDRNGEAMAACRIRMRASFGLSRQRALVRCLPLVRAVEDRFLDRRELLLGRDPA